MTEDEVKLYKLGNAMLRVCPFSNKPICKFPCRVCKICRISKCCMGCINPKRKLKFPCTEHNVP